MEFIKIRGARQHNLKNINLDIPKGKLVVFTGLSGSGKSSLAFDTIYAEGQRRYVESLSSYARQFLGIMAKPDMDTIEGLSPAISIDQKTTSHNPRSTVGTITEIYDYLRLLFARVGHPHCPVCGKEIAPQSAEQIVINVLKLVEERIKEEGVGKFLVLAPLVDDRKGEFSGLFSNLRAKGYTRVRVDRRFYSLTEELILLKNNKHTIEVEIDRLVMERKQWKDEIARANLKSRLTEAVESGLKLADGKVKVGFVTDSGFDLAEYPEEIEEHLFSEQFACPVDNISLPEIEPRTFSFNSPHGACPKCSGIGSFLRVDPELAIQPELTLWEGGILPFGSSFENDTWYARLVAKVAEKVGINPRAPLARATKEQLDKLLYGTGDKVYKVEGANRFGEETVIRETFAGIVPEMMRRYSETSSEAAKAQVEKYMRQEICPDCKGARLKNEALSVAVRGKSIIDVTNWDIKTTKEWVEELMNNKGKELSERELTIALPILKEIDSRLGFLVAVGLDYLTLSRAAGTLAGGEAQRIRLASQIGSGLSGVLYVLDEPSIGLHQKDNRKLIETLKRLRDLGNTVVVVEHDREMMEEADFLVDFGPGGGAEGGEVVFTGTVDEMKKDEKSLTGKYLRGVEKVEIPRNLRPVGDSIVLKGASQFNLKNIDVKFPLGQLVIVTGVSGSGKSTLVVETLYHEMAKHLSPFHKEKPGDNKGIEGVEKIDKVILIDQSPIGKTSRSNPATYTTAFTTIRELFTMASEAKVRGYHKGRFSFNVKGGRCEACEGQGETKIEMQFLPDIYVTCDICKGKRYNAATLEVEYKGKNIAEVLEMSVNEAAEFFGKIPGLSDKLETLKQVGLGYVKLGQPAPTLSGGEAQRVKLAAELAKRATGKTVYILDEPTTGLHFADLQKLLWVLRKLVDKGNTVIVIEHNLDMIAQADYVIDLGPEGGDRGGEIVALGSVAEVADVKESYTGQFLKKILRR